MDQQNAAVLQERTKPGHVKLPKRLEDAQEFRFKPRWCYPVRLASSGESARGAGGRQRNSWFGFGE
jgi:hypothetical protein